MAQDWRDWPRGRRLDALEDLGLGTREAMRVDRMAQAGRDHPVPHNPLVHGWVHPGTGTVHKDHQLKDGVTACGKPLDHYEELTPGKLKRRRADPDRVTPTPCRSCYDIQGRV